MKRTTAIGNGLRASGRNDSLSQQKMVLNTFPQMTYIWSQDYAF